jgi:hypothetical protein
MNGRFQMQGGKNWIFAEIDQRKPVLLGLSLAGNLVKPLMSLYGNEWSERGYGLRIFSGKTKNICEMDKVRACYVSGTEEKKTSESLRWKV